MIKNQEPKQLLIYQVLNWPRLQIKKLYNWVIKWAGHRNAERALAGIAFAESSFFPIPPDPLLIAMTTSKPAKWMRFALICTGFSVLGALLGYIIGIGLLESVGQWLINTYDLHSEFETIGHRYQDNALLTVFTAAFTPIPYKLITIAAGAFKVNLITLIIASIFGRGARFFLVAGLMHVFGARYAAKIEKYIDILGLIFVALLVAGFVAIKYVL